MDHRGTQRLETERLILRRFALNDASAMFRNWASDGEVTRFLTWPTHKSVETTQWVLDSWVPHYGENNYYHWAITLKENGDEPIGDIAAVRLDEDAACAEIGYCLGRALMNACIDCAKDAGYTQLELNAAAENERALSLYRSLGFIEYGRNPRGFNSRLSGYQELVYMRLEL